MKNFYLIFIIKLNKKLNVKKYYNNNNTTNRQKWKIQPQSQSQIPNQRFLEKRI